MSLQCGFRQISCLSGFLRHLQLNLQEMVMFKLFIQHLNQCVLINIALKIISINEIPVKKKESILFSGILWRFQKIKLATLIEVGKLYNQSSCRSQWRGKPPKSSKTFGVTFWLMSISHRIRIPLIFGPPNTNTLKKLKYP